MKIKTFIKVTEVPCPGDREEPDDAVPFGWAVPHSKGEGKHLDWAFKGLNTVIDQNYMVRHYAIWSRNLEKIDESHIELTPIE